MSTGTNTKSKINKTLLATAISSTLLLGSTGYLFYDNSLVKELNDKQTSEITALGEIKTKFESEIAKINSELEKYKGRNEELELLVANAKEEAAAKEEKIKKLMKQNTSLTKLQKEVKNYKASNAKNLERIKELEGSLSGLTSEREVLLAENTELKRQIEELNGKTELLSKKVEAGSVLRTENASLAVERNNKGKYTKSRIKKADRIVVSFDLAENKVTEPGEKTIYVRVLDGSKKLVENKNSDVFMNRDKNTAIPYTAKKSVNYGNKKQKIVIPVEVAPDQLDKGDYKIEIYCDGSFIGSSSASLK